MTPATEHLDSIATKVRGGTVRRDEPDRTWGGLGNGWTCDGCDRPITTSELEIEADFDLGATTLHFHVPCFLAWDRAAVAERTVTV